jgi:hypothetical protein
MRSIRVGVCWLLFVEVEQGQIHSLPNWELGDSARLALDRAVQTTICSRQATMVLPVVAWICILSSDDGNGWESSLRIV